MVKKAIIPAAGYGTRGLPITKVVPKEMFPIAGKPAIHYIVEEAAAAGIEEILIIVSREKNTIIDYFDRSPQLEAYLEKKQKLHLLEEVTLPDVHIQYVRQPSPRGLGDAILLGKHFTGNDPFAVLLPDDLIIGARQSGIAQMAAIYQKFKKNTVALNFVKTDQLQYYGVIRGERVAPLVYKMTDIIEKPKLKPPSNLAVVGRYILTPEIYKDLQTVTPDEGGEIQLTDALRRTLTESGSYGVELEGKRYDIGTKTGYEEAFIQMSGLQRDE